MYSKYYFVSEEIGSYTNHKQGSYRQVGVKFKDFSRTSPASQTVFKDLKLMKNTNLSVQILLQKC